jgi:hypothetical protein
MRSLFGLVQGALLVWGVVNLFHSDFVQMAVLFSCAGLVGLAGSRATKRVFGVSDGSRDALAALNEADNLIRTGDCALALSKTQNAISLLRIGADHELLCFSLPMHAIALAGNDKIAEARNAIYESDQLARSLPPGLHAEYQASYLSLNNILNAELTLIPYNNGRIASHSPKFMEFIERVYIMKRRG